MRLSEEQKNIIVSAFHETFSKDDHIWLFGSRVDDTKKGGDIDLYIETEETSYATVLDNKLRFLTKLTRKLGERKIDVVIKQPHKNLPIHQEARNTGILLS